MYCNNCSTKLLGTEKYCPSCGILLKKGSGMTIITDEDRKIENKRIASIVLGIIALAGLGFFLFAPVSLILSIIGLVLAIKVNKVVRNTPSIIMNSVAIFISFCITSLIIFVISVMIGIIKTAPDYLNIDEFYHGDPIIERNKM